MAHDPNQTTHTTNQNAGGGGRSSTGIAFIVGILVVIVAVLAYFMFARPAGDGVTNIRVESPAVIVPDPAPPAADAADDDLPPPPVEGTDATGTPVPGN